MKMYRNYDGINRLLANECINNTVPNPDNVAAFSAHVRDGVFDGDGD
jgi:hypothetical protein